MIILIILFFGLLIFVHELGHFIFARIFKVKINEFSIGMGPKLFSKTKNEIKYSLRLLPIGGFVSMKGENYSPENIDDEGSFNSLFPYKKAIILVAGALVNIIFGFIIMVIAVSQTPTLLSTTISSVDKNLAVQGLQKGDKIIEINNNKIYDYMDINFFLSLDKDKIVDMKVIRNGKQKNFESIDLNSSSANFVKLEKSATNVLKKGFHNSISVIRVVFASLQKMITGDIGIDNLAGPIGTIDVLGSAAKSAKKTRNFSGLLFLLALISINIGVFNLLPIPGLDGGRLLFVVIEGIRRKPVSLKAQAIFNSIGMLILFGLIFLVTANDLMRIFKG